ncbi:MAG: glycosyltransferase [candidate division KSB1 bacterium]|nr:glycosyltransferase [candidate division KSB1 bacterium]
MIANGHPIPGLEHYYTFIAEQARALAKYIHLSVVVTIEVLFRVPKQRYQVKVSKKFPKYRSDYGYTVFFPRAYRYFPGLNKYLADNLMLWSILYYIWRNKLQFDLIHTHFAHPAGYIGAIIAKHFRKPHILTVHGSDILEEFVPNEIVRLRKHHRDFALQMANRIISVSNYLKHVLIARGIAPEKMIVIPNGIDTNIFIPEIDLNGHVDILFVGNLIELKGIDLLIQAFHKFYQKYPNLNLKIIGEGPLRDKLCSLALKLGISDRVNFLGPMQNRNVARILSKARLLCLPSRQEGFGVVAIEALASGVPVVGARTGGIIDIITSDNIGFLFEPGNSDDLALKLEAALNKNWDKNAIRKEGLKYSWELIADRIIEQYHVVQKK